MARYIKFRLTAAKVGVSMALAALIAGITEKVQSNPTINATEAASRVAAPAAHQAAGITFFGKHIGGLSSSLKTALLTVEQKDKGFSKQIKQLQKAVSNVYDKPYVNANFLKIDKANQAYLKIDDASQQYLKHDGTAANSFLLGNLPASSFFQGHGNVVSGALTVNGDGNSRQLVSSPDGAVSVLIALNQPGANGPVVTIQNNTGQLLPAVQDLNGRTTSLNLQPGPNQVPVGTGANQLHLQTFPGSGGGFNSIIAVLVSLEPNPNDQNQLLASGQMLDGGA